MARAPQAAFAPNVLTAVMAHMNGHHRDDCILIARAFGGLDVVNDAVLTDLNERGAVFTAVTPDRAADVVVAWARPMVHRSDHRDEMARMYREACARLGVDPRGS
jgi:hypothetical protein